MKTLQNMSEEIRALVRVGALFLALSVLGCSYILHGATIDRQQTEKQLAILQMERIHRFQAQQSKELPVVESLFQRIHRFDPGTRTNYEENDIKYYLSDLQDIAAQNGSDARYRLFLHLSNFYAAWLIDKKELWSKQQNIITFRQNLDACEINTVIKRRL
ncbi:hypothetical protein AGMMS4957_16140 [Bacteroidia bacterium]|nr:hypothetical protein AGMMS4957_16140 [Bacteroidia bacterium]